MMTFEECAALERRAINARREAGLYRELKPLWRAEQYGCGEGPQMVGGAFTYAVDAVRTRNWKARLSFARALFEAEAPRLHETAHGPAEFRTAEGTWAEVQALATLNLGRGKVQRWMVPYIEAHAPICAEYLRRGCVGKYEKGATVWAFQQLHAAVFGEVAA